MGPPYSKTATGSCASVGSCPTSPSSAPGLGRKSTERGSYTVRWTGEAESVAYLAALGQEASPRCRRPAPPAGRGSLPVLRCVSPEPWYFSADSAVWSTAARYGRQLSTSPFRFGRQERPAIHGLGDGDILVERTWEQRAATSIACTLHAACDRTPVLGDFERAGLVRSADRTARRFGCDDETEAMHFLDDVLGPSLMHDAAGDGFDNDARRCAIPCLTSQRSDRKWHTSTRTLSKADTRS